MAKLKYYQIAVKGYGAKRLVSPSRKLIEDLKADGYKVKGYSKKSDMPVNPIASGNTIKEMTATQLADYQAYLQSEKDTLESIKKQNYINKFISSLESADSSQITNIKDILGV